MTKETYPELHPVDSSLIAAVGYDELLKDLAVQFKRGGETIYLYEEVPPEVYREMMVSDSIGRFFLAKIKHVYRFKKIAKTS